MVEAGWTSLRLVQKGKPMKVDMCSMRRGYIHMACDFLQLPEETIGDIPSTAELKEGFLICPV